MLLAGILLTLLPAGSALAHTGLESSDPEAGVTLHAAPEEVSLTYTKPVELLGESVVLTDAQGQRATLARTSLSEDHHTVAAVPAEPLADGPWTVSWRVLASDSHPREGAFDFRIEGPHVDEPDASATGADGRSSGGDASAEEAAVDPTPPAPTLGRRLFELLGGASRIVLYVGLMVAAGLALFKAGPHRGEASRAGRLAHIAAVGAATALVASAIEVVSHVGALAGRGLPGVLDAPTWRAVMRTGLGTAFLVRSIGLVLLLAGAARRLRRALPSGPDLLKLAGAAIAIASFQFVGHTASAAPAWIVRSADAVHAVAAAIWIGGLVGLAVISRTKGDREAGIRTAGRFSSVASVAVAAVALAGIALSWVNFPDLSAVYETGYGQLLLAKLVLVAGLGAIGAHNHFRVVPRLERGEEAALDQLKRTVRAEVVIVLVVIALTALLVNASPT